MPEDTAVEAHTLATVASARLDAHEKTCAERYGRIAGDTAEIKAAIQALSADVKSAVQRIHERIDNESHIARDAVASAHTAVAGLKIWVLSSAGTVLLGIIGWLADHFFTGKR